MVERTSNRRGIPNCHSAYGEDGTLKAYYMIDMPYVGPIMVQQLVWIKILLNVCQWCKLAVAAIVPL